MASAGGGKEGREKRGVRLLHGMLGMELDIHSYWKTSPLD